jgi:uncharacterized protein (DUF2235 family)
MLTPNGLDSQECVIYDTVGVGTSGLSDTLISQRPNNFETF